MSGSYVDLAINDNDLISEDGKIKLVYRADEVLQRVRTRLRKIKGEWFLNINTGIPYYEGQILGGKDFNYIKLVISAEIINTEGVSDIQELNLITDPKTKKTSIYAAIIIDESVYELTEEV